jgi:hypothetical protein
MKRMLALIPCHAGAASLLLTLCLLLLAGCSEGGASANPSQAKPLEESDILALKKAARNDQEFKRSLKNKILEKGDIALPTRLPAKGTTRPH